MLSQFLKKLSIITFMLLFGSKVFADGHGSIKIGILHSLSGTMAISETTLKDTMLMLIDEQNKKGGLLGKKLEPVVVDPASNWPLFAEKARELLTVSDASINLLAVDELKKKFNDLELIIIESGGDNLAATFSPELVDLSIYVIDVAMGGDIPRKGGPAITRSDLLIINKTDLAPYVGVNLDLMKNDVEHARNDLPYVFGQMKNNQGVEAIVNFLNKQGGLSADQI